MSFGDVKMNAEMSQPTVELHQSREENEKQETCLNDLQNNDVGDDLEESKNQSRKRKNLHGYIDNKGVQEINSECNSDDNHQENADFSNFNAVQICQLEERGVSTLGNSETKEKEKGPDVALDIAVHASLRNEECKRNEKEECAAKLEFSDSENFCAIDDAKESMRRTLVYKKKCDMNQIMDKHDTDIVVHGDPFKDEEIETSKRRRIEKSYSPEEVSTPQILLSSSEIARYGAFRRKLLILDVNGLLADIITSVPKEHKPDIIIGMKSVFKRPFCEEFLQFCFKRFDLGVWSSRTKRNLDKLVDFLFGDSKHQLLFCWDQDQCTDTGCMTPGNMLNKPLFLKELIKLWDNHEMNLPWEKGYYNESNTILLDDTPYKALRNPPNTAIFPPPFQFNDDKDDLLGPDGLLRNYLEGLAVAENSQEHIKQNPFGQKPVSETHPHWSFFRKIIDGGGIIRLDDGDDNNNNNNNNNQFNRGGDGDFYRRNDRFSGGERRDFHRRNDNLFARGGRFGGGEFFRSNYDNVRRGGGFDG